MTKHRLIQIKLTGDRVWELHLIYQSLHQSYQSENDHELLLKGHISEMADKLKSMADRGQFNYTLPFTGTETLAFVQIWQSEPMALTPFQALIIQSIFDKLDIKKIEQKRLQSLNN